MPSRGKAGTAAEEMMSRLIFAEQLGRRLASVSPAIRSLP
jgi:hypothetical protein